MASKNSGQKRGGRHHPSGTPFPSPLFAFHLARGDRRERKKFLKLFPTHSLLNNPSSFDPPFDHLSTIFFSSNPPQIVLLLLGPQPRLWLLSTCTQKPLPMAQSSAVSLLPEFLDRNDFQAADLQKDICNTTCS